MELHGEISVQAPASTAWRIVGERFGHIGEWAAPIGCSTMEEAPQVGAIRSCHIERFGPVPAGVIRERLITYDPEQMRVEYVADSGMPSFFAKAVNRWLVTADGPVACIVRTHATLELRGPIVLFGPLLAWRFRADGARVLDELRHHIETGTAHPRKQEAMTRAARGT